MRKEVKMTHAGGSGHKGALKHGAVLKVSMFITTTTLTHTHTHTKDNQRSWQRSYRICEEGAAVWAL